MKLVWNLIIADSTNDLKMIQYDTKIQTKELTKDQNT